MFCADDLYLYKNLQIEIKVVLITAAPPDISVMAMSTRHKLLKSRSNKYEAYIYSVRG